MIVAKSGEVVVSECGICQIPVTDVPVYQALRSPTNERQNMILRWTEHIVAGALISGFEMSLRTPLRVLKLMALGAVSCWLQ